MKKLSLYVHIPFCVKKCLYCDFLSGPASVQERQNYMHLLQQEILKYGRKLGSDYCVDTIFIGGGTPSCLTPEQIVELGETIHQAFPDRSSQMELTTEANPGTVTRSHVYAWKTIGINRISLGLQSAQNEELRRLGRIHTYEQFLDTYELIRNEGCSNINIDLMSDIPGQTMESYADTLSKVVALAPDHISSYSLIIEPETPFFEMDQKGLLEIADEETDRRMYEFTQQYLAEHGYHRYEISNYAKRGYECQHNVVYWTGSSYLGAGLGASSYMNGVRWSNPSQIFDYEKRVVQMDQSIYGLLENYEQLTIGQQIEEFMFLGLRMMQGISRTEFQTRFHLKLDQIYGDVLKELFAKKLLAEDTIRDRIYLTKRGIDISNPVLARFLLDEVNE